MRLSHFLLACWLASSLLFAIPLFDSPEITFQSGVSGEPELGFQLRFLGGDETMRLALQQASANPSSVWSDWYDYLLVDTAALQTGLSQESNALLPVEQRTALLHTVQSALPDATRISLSLRMTVPVMRVAATALGYVPTTTQCIAHTDCITRLTGRGTSLLNRTAALEQSTLSPTFRRLLADETLAPLVNVSGDTSATPCVLNNLIAANPKWGANICDTDSTDRNVHALCNSLCKESVPGDYSFCADPQETLSAFLVCDPDVTCPAGQLRCEKIGSEGNHFKPSSISVACQGPLMTLINNANQCAKSSLESMLAKNTLGEAIDLLDQADDFNTAALASNQQILNSINENTIKLTGPEYQAFVSKQVDAQRSVLNQISEGALRLQEFGADMYKDSLAFYDQLNATRELADLTMQSDNDMRRAIFALLQGVQDSSTRVQQMLNSGDKQAQRHLDMGQIYAALVDEQRLQTPLRRAVVNGHFVARQWVAANFPLLRPFLPDGEAGGILPLGTIPDSFAPWSTEQAFAQITILFVTNSPQNTTSSDPDLLRFQTDPWFAEQGVVGSPFANRPVQIEAAYDDMFSRRTSAPTVAPLALHVRTFKFYCNGVYLLEKRSMWNTADELMNMMSSPDKKQCWVVLRRQRCQLKTAGLTTYPLSSTIANLTLTDLTQQGAALCYLVDDTNQWFYPVDGSNVTEAVRSHDSLVNSISGLPEYEVLPSAAAINEELGVYTCQQAQPIQNFWVFGDWLRDELEQLPPAARPTNGFLGVDGTSGLCSTERQHMIRESEQYKSEHPTLNVTAGLSFATLPHSFNLLLRLSTQQLYANVSSEWEVLMYGKLPSIVTMQHVTPWFSAPNTPNAELKQCMTEAFNPTSIGGRPIYLLYPDSQGATMQLQARIKVDTSSGQVALDNLQTVSLLNSNPDMTVVTMGGFLDCLVRDACGPRLDVKVGNGPNVTQQSLRHVYDLEQTDTRSTQGTLAGTPEAWEGYVDAFLFNFEPNEIPDGSSPPDASNFTKLALARGYTDTLPPGLETISRRLEQLDNTTSRCKKQGRIASTGGICALLDSYLPLASSADPTWDRTAAGGTLQWLPRITSKSARVALNLNELLRSLSVNLTLSQRVFDMCGDVRVYSAKQLFPALLPDNYTAWEEATQTVLFQLVQSVNLSSVNTMTRPLRLLREQEFDTVDLLHPETPVWTEQVEILMNESVLGTLSPGETIDLPGLAYSEWQDQPAQDPSPSNGYVRVPAVRKRTLWVSIMAGDLSGIECARIQLVPFRPILIGASGNVTLDEQTAVLVHANDLLSNFNGIALGPLASMMVAQQLAAAQGQMSNLVRRVGDFVVRRGNVTASELLSNWHPSLSALAAELNLRISSQKLLAQRLLVPNSTIESIQSHLSNISGTLDQIQLLSDALGPAGLALQEQIFNLTADAQNRLDKLRILADQIKDLTNALNASQAGLQSLLNRTDLQEAIDELANTPFDINLTISIVDGNQVISDLFQPFVDVYNYVRDVVDDNPDCFTFPTSASQFGKTLKCWLKLIFKWLLGILAIVLVPILYIVVIVIYIKVYCKACQAKK